MLSRNALLSAMSLLAATHQHASPPPPDWPEGVTELRIRSTADGSDQPALTWSPTGEEARPLLVGLRGGARALDQAEAQARHCSAWRAHHGALP